MQSDTEKLKGLPVTPFMDRDKVSKPSCQTSFIRFVLLPLFTELIKLFPCLEVSPPPRSEPVNLNAIHLNQHVLPQQHILEPVRHALEYYSEMERTTKEEKRTTKA